MLLKMYYRSGARAVATVGWVVVAALYTLPAHAGLFGDNEARQAILDLRAQNETLSTQVEAVQRALLDQGNRLDQLQQQVNTLRGQNEVFANQLSGVQRQQESNYANLDARLKKFEPTEQTIDGVQGVVQPGESNAFDAALQQFRNGSYKQAATAFRGFLQRYPQSLYLPSAQYWLGNSLYALHDYTNSKKELDKLIRNYPNHPRVPEALLALAYDQIAQNQKGAARKTLQQILTQYPSASVAQDANKALDDLK